MLDKEEILAYLLERKEELFSEFQLVKLGLFGSFARNEESELSDIDLLIEFEPNTKGLSNKKQKIKELIHQKFHRKVDVCRKKYIKSYFKNQILQSVIYV